MKIVDDGIIKYDRTNFSQCGPLLALEYTALEYWRKKLFKLNLIGEYQESKIGFGNLSMIYDYSDVFQGSRPQFIISGTQTGKYPELDGRYYTRILDYIIRDLKITMQGPIEASSEALTHAAIYEKNPIIKSVFHIHSPVLWKMMIEKNLPFTSANIPYGTYEMAQATQQCIADTSSGVFCMHGHTDGIVSYGTSLEESWVNIMRLSENMI
jgi:ribulose-5-phosphate 4-epimerase/fuculose-1-phosphate aldolase